MLDLTYIRENAERVRAALKTRAPKLDFDAFLALDARRRECLKELEALRAEKNKANDRISALLKDKKDPKDVIASMKSISARIGELDKQAGGFEEQIRRELLYIPNLPHASVPQGTDASHNIETARRGQIRTFDFAPKDHVALGAALGLFDTERGAKLSGSGFILYKGPGALLERALIQLMLDTHTRRHGYTEFSVPFMVVRQSMIGTGQVPKFEEDMYRLRDEDSYLIPTAEVPLTNIHRDETLAEEELPLKYTAYTPCFRREAGAYGKDTKGLVRVHQFDKVELVKFCVPESSYDEHETLLRDALAIVELLDIPYRVMQLCSGDMGFAAAKCYDIEVWAPGLGRWLEASSVSNFEDFQARRANIRFRRKGSKKSDYVHTLNGSGLALPRIVIAILENFQNADGSVVIPEPLRSYMNGMTLLKN